MQHEEDRVDGVPSMEPLGEDEIDMTPFDEETKAELAERLQTVPEEVRIAIRDYRETTFGWSQARVARELKEIGMPLDATAITRIESGKRAVRVDELWAFAAVFRVSVDAILSTLPTARSLEERIELEEERLAWGERSLADQQDEVQERRDRVASLRRQLKERDS